MRSRILKALGELVEDLAERSVPPLQLEEGPAEQPACRVQCIAARAAAKKAKAFETADAIRAELLKQGVVLEDKPGGVTEWRRA